MTGWIRALSDAPVYLGLMAFLGLYPVVTGLYWIVGAAVFSLHRERADPDFYELQEHPHVSVLVAAHNEETVIYQTVQCLLKLDWPSFDVTVVDDGSSDRTSELLVGLAEAGEIRLLTKRVNEGKAMALNDALPLLAGEIVLIVDADGRPQPDVLRWMVPHFVKVPRVAAVTGNPRVINTTTLLAKLQAIEFTATVSVLRRAQATWGRLTTFSGHLHSPAQERDRGRWPLQRKHGHRGHLAGLAASEHIRRCALRAARPVRDGGPGDARGLVETAHPLGARARAGPARERPHHASPPEAADVARLDRGPALNLLVASVLPRRRLLDTGSGDGRLRFHRQPDPELLGPLDRQRPRRADLDRPHTRRPLRQLRAPLRTMDPPVPARILDAQRRSRRPGNATRPAACALHGAHHLEAAALPREVINRPQSGQRSPGRTIGSPLRAQLPNLRPSGYEPISGVSWDVVGSVDLALLLRIRPTTDLPMSWDGVGRVCALFALLSDAFPVH